MDPKLEKFRNQIERAGGVVFLRDDLPEEIKELFLRELMSCPDCVAEIAAAAKNAPPGH